MLQSRAQEVAEKLAAVARFLHEHSLDRILIQRRGPVGWLLAGLDTHVRMDTEDGVALVSVDRDGKAVLFTDVIEGPRLVAEELRSLSIEVVTSPWTHKRVALALAHAHATKAGAKALAAESTLGSVNVLAGDAAEAFRALRYSFGEAELVRYRALCREGATDLEATTRGIARGMTEHEVAADLARRVIARGCRPTVILVAFDERIARFRHPVPTDTRLERRAMVVLCAERGGQVMAATRFAGLVPLTQDLQRRFDAVIAVDAAAIAATRAGAAVKDVFAAIQGAYARHGYADEWQLHHQGGSIGYAGREYKGAPDAPWIVRARQPFAWNPSITGTKCEDTILAGETQSEILTATGTWPTVATAAGPRPTELLCG